MKYYGMFTDAGNEAIDGLVTTAKALDLQWKEVYFALQVLARKPEFAEATDTMVREYVYDAMGFESEFYV
jgi:hypothetical protein